MNSMLVKEPDLAIRILVLLPAADICRAELVCSTWRGLIIEYNVWKNKLIKKWHSNYFWRDILQQNNWNRNESSHEVNKDICLQITTIIPDEQSDNILKIVLKESPSNETIHPKTKLQPNFEHLFLQRLVSDRNRIISKLPKRPRGRIGWRRGPRKISFPLNSVQPFSRLLLFSPSAFPILVSKVNRYDIILAGARYGKGRIIVASHHDILNHDSLIQVRNVSNFDYIKEGLNSYLIPRVHIIFALLNREQQIGVGGN